MNHQYSATSTNSQSYWVQAVAKVERRRAFEFSKRSFAAAFGAHIVDDTEEFYAVIDRSGCLVAAFGLNRKQDNMACRKYLDAASIEDAVAAVLAMERPRIQMVELCHLGLSDGRVLCQLLPVLAAYLGRGANTLICTATEQLAKHFIKRGFAPHLLGQAKLEHLPLTERHHWGSYYRTAPQVLVGELARTQHQGGLTNAA